MSEDEPTPRPGEKGPPAWEERSDPDERPMPDEPPNSSGEVGQEQGLPPAPGSGDENEEDG